MKNALLKLKNEQGYSLLMSLFAVILLSLLGISILGVSTNTLKTTSNERLDQSIYYIAEAGLIEKRPSLYSEIQDAYSQAVDDYTILVQDNANKPPHQQVTIDFKAIFKNKLNTEVDLSDETFVHYEPQFSHQPESTVEIVRNVEADKIIYTIISTGKLTGKERKVSQDVEVILDSASYTTSSGGTGDTASFAVYSRNNIEFAYYDIRNNIKGQLASASNSSVVIDGWYPNPIDITYDTDSFDILANDVFKEQLNFNSNDFENINYHPNNSNLIKNGSLIGNWDEHNDKVLTLSDHLKLQTFSTSSNLTFTIDVGSSDKILYVDNLTFDGTFNVIGSGSLTIYVKNKLDFNHSDINVNGEPSKLNIYYAGNDKVTIANGIKLKANLFIKDADLHFSGGSGFSGSIYSNGDGKTTIDGGTVSKDVVFVMPNSDITLTGGTNFIGSILCNDLYIDGNTKIDSQAGGGLGGGGTIDINQSDPIVPKSIVEIQQ